MPKAWSNKRERQYEHIKSSAKKRGRGGATAKRIAAATVNKTRSEKGETKGSSRSRRSTSSRSRRSTGTRRSGGSRAQKRRAGRKGGRASARK
jgi:hypothetical protein